MGIFLSALIGALVAACGSLVGKVLVSLGIGYATYQGTDLMIGWVRDLAISNMSSLPVNAVRVMSAAKVGTCISILTSALVARLTVNGLTSGTLKKFTLK